MFVIEVIQVGMSRYEHFSTDQGLAILNVDPRPCRCAHKFRGSHTAEQVAKQATEEMLNECEIGKQRIHIILHFTM